MSDMISLCDSGLRYADLPTGGTEDDRFSPGPHGYQKNKAFHERRDAIRKADALELNGPDSDEEADLSHDDDEQQVEGSNTTKKQKRKGKGKDKGKGKVKGNTKKRKSEVGQMTSCLHELSQHV